MIEAAQGIEEFFRRRYGREALFLPSGRLALYLIFREWFRPGDRILMSPVNDDVVFFTVLAAGLIPVLGPVDPATGNLAPGTVDEATWSRVQGVMTTNLYGFPDRMDLLEERGRRHGVRLVEDACQALDSRAGERRIGTFADVAAFSLTKHVDGAGGVLVFREGSRRESLLRRAREEVRRPTPAEAIVRRGHRFVSALASAAGVREAAGRVRRRLRPPVREREGHRMECDWGEVIRAARAGGGLDRFDRWVRVDNALYRTEPLPESLSRTFRELEGFEENRRQRLEGARRLLGLDLAPRWLPAPTDTALFRVPLFVEGREEILAAFEKRGLRLDYIYDPPLDLYAPSEIAERTASPPASKVWSANVLPVDPLRADRFLEILARSPKPVPARADALQ